MKINEIAELFRSKIGFLYEKKFHKINEVKLISQKIIITTDKRTFSKFPSEIESFMNEIQFCEEGPSKPVKTSEVLPEKAHDVSVLGFESLETKGLFLPQSSIKVKEMLDEMIKQFSSNDIVSPEMIKKANMMCNVADKVIAVEKLQLDYVKLQIKK